MIKIAQERIRRRSRLYYLKRKGYIMGWNTGSMKTVMIGIVIALLTLQVVADLVTTLIPNVLNSFTSISTTALSTNTSFASGGAVRAIVGVVVLLMFIILAFNMMGTGEGRGKGKK